ncbi:hypothetical protein [Pseudomonas sp. Marseille-QA0892]
MMRRWCVLSVLCVLAACKPEESTRPEKPAEPAKADHSIPKVTTSTEIGKPLVAPLNPPPAPAYVPEVPELALPEMADAGNMAAVEETKPVAPANKPTIKIVKAKPKPAPSIKDELPAAKLDMTLPEELIKVVEPDAEQTADASILPPLFGPRDSSFSLNGRILKPERQEDADGAEIQFEFRR